MRATFLLIAIASAAPGASAEAATPSGYTIAVPKDWHEDIEAAARVTASTHRESHLLGAPFTATVRAWSLPNRAALYVTELTASNASDDPAKAVRDELDATTAGPSERSAIADLERSESVDAGIAEATVHWKHLSSETETFVRTLAFVSADRVRILRADCVVSSSEDDDVGQACRAALVSLEPSMPVDRAALATVPTTGANQASSPGPEIGPVGDEPRVLYVGETPESKKSHRWLFLVGGALVLGAVAMSLRKRRTGDEGDAPTTTEDGASADDGEREGSSSGEGDEQR